ncbi:MAG: ABC transporter permease subunit, partial [Meiothermus sp.]|nr:ABC transporter permease subunit [Meiothermus sp.]
PEVLEVLKYGLFTGLRVTLVVLLAILVWVPLGVYIGLRPHLTQWVQPLAQFGAAFPANLLFPLFVVGIDHYRLNPEIWVSPLMVLGAQWYLLFNVIAGTAAIPNDLKEAARIYGLRGWQVWRRLILPAIFPAFVTGGITASGGTWNASIVAEVVSWGNTTLTATGLGAYIARWSTGAFNPHVGLGMLVMGLLVLAYNRLLWRRLFQLAEERYRLD